MRIYYTCDSCGDAIDTVEVDQVDEVRFGFDCLTSEERQDLIKYDAGSGIMYVQSLCDSCIEALGLAEEGPPAAQGKSWLH